MRLLDLFRPAAARSSRSADAAKERLQLLLALERSGGSGPSFLPQLQRDILEVIKRYIEIDSNKVTIELERGQTVSLLEVNVELPAGATEGKGGLRAVASTGAL